jgi:hypothetical protein
MHTHFEVKEVAKYGDSGRYKVEWSARFDGIVYHDCLMLYADDEIDAFRLAMKHYGGDDVR